MRSKNDITKLYQEAVKDANDLGIKSARTIDPIVISGRMTKSFGQCVIYRSGLTRRAKITVTKRFLEEEIPDDIIRNTLMHEYIHAVCPAHEGHGPKFQQLAGKVNGAYPGRYHVQTYVQGAEANKMQEVVPAKYITQCPVCGKEFYHQRMSKSVKNCGDYWHCNKAYRLVRIK